jgi:hypothetical protein
MKDMNKEKEMFLEKFADYFVVKSGINLVEPKDEIANYFIERMKEVEKNLIVRLLNNCGFTPREVGLMLSQDNQSGCEKCGRTSDVVDMNNCPFCHKGEKEELIEPPYSKDDADRIHFTTPSNWEEEFDSMFDWAEQIKEKELAHWKLMYGFTPTDLKSFFHATLAKEREKWELDGDMRVLALIERMMIPDEKMDVYTDFGKCDAYNTALTTLKSKLTEKEG